MGSPRHGHRQNDGRAAFHGHRHNDGHAAHAVGREQTIAQLKLEAVELKRKGKYGAALVKLYEAKAREAKDEHIVRAREEKFDPGHRGIRELGTPRTGARKASLKC